MFFMRLLFLLFSLLLVTQCAVFGQQASATWPFPNLNRPNCTSMPPATSTCTIWAKQNGYWEDTATWSSRRIPGHKDIVCIDSNKTVIVRTQVYKPSSDCPTEDSLISPQLFIFVCGKLEFENSGKLQIACNSSLNIMPQKGIAVPAQGNSDLIQIGSNIVWGKDNATLIGPYCLCDGCPPNSGGCSYSAPLPSKLISFSANQKNQYQVDLSWSTLQEINAENFIVEKSINSANWIQIGNIAAVGGENIKKVYSLSDNKPNQGVNYYRIRKNDRGGHYDYSNIIQVNFKGSVSSFSVFPNPVKDKITIYSKGGFNQGSQVQLYHKNGVLLETKYIQSANEQTMDVSNLSNSVYLLRIVDAKGTTLHTQSVIKN